MSNAAPSAPFGADQQAAIERFFKGNSALYLAFSKAAIGQFPVDMQAVDAAIQAGDAAALRRTAHNLKGALRMLGFAEQAEKALQLELAACAADQATAAQVWRGLEGDLKRLLASIVGTPVRASSVGGREI